MAAVNRSEYDTSDREHVRTDACPLCGTPLAQHHSLAVHLRYRCPENGPPLQDE